jgi:hypothetical protein
MGRVMCMDAISKSVLKSTIVKLCSAIASSPPVQSPKKSLARGIFHSVQAPDVPSQKSLIAVISSQRSTTGSDDAGVDSKQTSNRQSKCLESTSNMFQTAVENTKTTLRINIDKP